MKSLSELFFFSLIDSENKITAFEYFQYKLVKWFCEANELVFDKAFASKISEVNDLSLIKTFKLHFLISAVQADTNNDGGLLNVFNNFKALPYGPVETDIYNAVENFDKFQINRSGTILKEKFWSIDENYADQIIRELVDLSFEEVKKVNAELINLEPFTLVDISHEWLSWSEAYKTAQSLGLRSYPMLPSDIISDPKRTFSIKSIFNDFI